MGQHDGEICPNCGLLDGDHTATCSNRPHAPFAGIDLDKPNYGKAELTAERVLRLVEARLTGNTPQGQAVILALGDIRDYFRRKT